MKKATKKRIADAIELINSHFIILYNNDKEMFSREKKTDWRFNAHYKLAFKHLMLTHLQNCETENDVLINKLIDIMNFPTFNILNKDSFQRNQNVFNLIQWTIEKSNTRNFVTQVNEFFQSKFEPRTSRLAITLQNTKEVLKSWKHSEVDAYILNSINIKDISYDDSSEKEDSANQEDSKFEI